MAILTDIIREENAPKTLSALVKGIGAKVTCETLSESLLLHPEFPSLLSMSEVLSDFAIDNASLQLNTIEQLRELPTPFVAHTGKYGGWYVLVTAIQGERIICSDSENGRITESLDSFGRQWSGVVLLAEASEQSGEVNYDNKHQKEIVDELRGPSVIATVLLLVGLGLANVAPTFNTTDWLWLVTKSAGLVLSCLLVRKQVGGANSFVDRFCRINEKTDCDSVLTSAGATVWGSISWSDVGLVYFVGGVLTLLILPERYNVLAILSMLTLPYVIYSIYYQWRILGQWCALCLSIQVILVIEVLLMLVSEQPVGFEEKDLELVPFLFLVPMILWVTYKSLLSRKAITDGQRYELMRFKRNPFVFASMMEKQPEIPPIDGLRTHVLGNAQASNAIVMIANVYCEPCLIKIEKIINILKNRNDFKLVIIYFPVNGKDNLYHPVIERIFMLDDEGKNGLEVWIKNKFKFPEDWVKSLEQKEIPSEYSQLVRKNWNWCRNANIKSTPTFFVNGKLLPTLYNDVQSFLHLFKKEYSFESDLAKSQ